MVWRWSIVMALCALIVWNRPLFLPASPVPDSPYDTKNPYHAILAGKPLNLNTASQADLEAIPGIGEVMAQSIVDYRQKHGTFRSLSELAQVRGIGPKRISTLSPFLTVTGQ